MSFIPQIHWGDGSDGNVTISVDTNLAGQEKQYNNLTINAGVKLYDSTGILKIKVKNKLILNGTIDMSGLGNAGAAGGTAPTYQSNGLFNNDSTAGGTSTGIWGSTVAGKGGNGHLSTYGTNAGSVAPDSALLMSYLQYIDIITEFSTRSALSVKFGAGGSGGGAGGTCESYCGGANGGAGGAGGGIAIIYARRITGTGTITCAGLPGYSGSNGSANNSGTASYGSSGGGGGGGAGGLAIVYTKRKDSTISVVANGGAGGSRGYSSSGRYGQNGTAGAAGLVISKTWI